jgi:hypothetical protein
VRTTSALLTFGVAATAVALGLTNCTVTPNQECLTGPCVLDQSPAGPTSSSSGGDAGPMCMNPARGDYPCAIFDILHRKCHVCHATDRLPSSGAPFSLLTWEDTQLPLVGETKLRSVRMSEVILPGASPHMPNGCPTNCPPSGDLTSDERSTLEEYFSTCAVPVAEGTNQNCKELCDGTPCKPD